MSAGAVETAYSLKAGIRVDHVRICQMFSNLLGNALTHGASDKAIGMHADGKGEIFELSVQCRRANSAEED